MLRFVCQVHIQPALTRVIRFPVLTCLDGREAMLREVFETFDDRVTHAAYPRKHDIAERGENLWRVPGMCSGLASAAGRVARVVQAVLDAPMRAGQRQELLRTGLFRGQTGNRMDGLDGLLATHDPFPRFAANLGDARNAVMDAVVAI